MVFLMETMIDKKKLQIVREKCGFLSVSALVMLVYWGLCLWWSGLNVKMISFSTHHVAVKVCEDDNISVWVVVGVYGWPAMENKHLTLDLMLSIKSSTFLPIIFFGDFNEILHASEKDDGVMRSDRCIDAFRNAVDLCEIRDLGYHGGKFTWRRGNDLNHVIRERLDHFLANEDCGNLFPNFEVCHYPIYKIGSCTHCN